MLLCEPLTRGGKRRSATGPAVRGEQHGSAAAPPWFRLKVAPLERHERRRETTGDVQEEEEINESNDTNTLVVVKTEEKPRN